jgi:hypothetical protein
MGTEWRKSSRSTSESNCVEVSWRKSSHSTSDANCVEIAWRKSSRSGSESNCVEVAATGMVTAVRDSKNPHGPVLAFPVSSWVGFLQR